jgi:hypothetical protein
VTQIEVTEITTKIICYACKKNAHEGIRIISIDNLHDNGKIESIEPSVRYKHRDYVQICVMAPRGCEEFARERGGGSLPYGGGRRTGKFLI